MGNPKACISISGRFQRSGDRASAITWARYAVALKGGVSVAHSRLFEMYLEEGNLESAKRIGQEAFDFEPRNADFLALMEKLAVKQNDPEAAARYRARRSPDKLESVPARTFQELIKKQQVKRAVSNSPAAAPATLEEKPGRSGIGKLLDRFRGSGSGA